MIGEVETGKVRSGWFRFNKIVFNISYLKYVDDLEVKLG